MKSAVVPSVASVTASARQSPVELLVSDDPWARDHDRMVSLEPLTAVIRGEAAKLARWVGLAERTGRRLPANFVRRVEWLHGAVAAHMTLAGYWNVIFLPEPRDVATYSFCELGISDVESLFERAGRLA